MEQIELAAQLRSVTGKKVKKLRSAGLMPLVVYGRKTESVPIQAVTTDVARALALSSGQLIALTIEGEREPRMVLARDIQRDFIIRLLSWKSGRSRPAPLPHWTPLGYGPFVRPGVLIVPKGPKGSRAARLAPGRRLCPGGLADRPIGQYNGEEQAQEAARSASAPPPARITRRRNAPEPFWPT